MCARAAIGAAILLGYLVRTLGRERALTELRGSWRQWWLGLVGVAVLAGGRPGGGWWSVVGTLAVVLSSVAYACSGVIGQRSMSNTSGPVLATGAMIGAAVALVPLTLVQAPRSSPDADAILSLLALSVLGTALAQLVMYRLIHLVGARKMSLVMYLMPGFALLYGALLLDEPVTVPVLAGLALILAGIALGSGTIGAARREPLEASG